MLPDHQETARPTKQGLFCGVTRHYEAKNRGLADPVASLGTELQDSPDEVKAIRSSSVMTVSLDSCLSHRAARPPHPTRPYMPCSKKFINPNILEARPARRVLDPSAWRMRSSILENSLSLAQKVTYPSDRGQDRSWSRPKKVPFEDMACLFSSAKAVPSNPLIAPTAHCPETFDVVTELSRMD